MKLKQSLLKYLSPSSPAELRMAAAARTLDESLSAEDEATVLFVLSFDKDPSLSGTAKKSLVELPLERLLDALDSPLDPAVIGKLVELRGDDEAVQMMAAMNPGIDDATLSRLAETGPEGVILALSEDTELLAGKPAIKEALRKNPRTPHSVKLALSEFKPRAAGEAKKTAQPEKLDRDLTDEKRARADEQNIYKIIGQLNTGQRLKLALSGNKAARELLIKDANKVVANSVLKNPRITEEEVQKVAHTKGTSDDMLRQIARNKEWVKSYTIRVGMLTNPKTPLQVSLKLLDTVYEKDLQGLAKSKNIPGALASAARRKLESKGRG